MGRTRSTWVGGIVIGVLGGLGVWAQFPGEATADPPGGLAARFEVDPWWAKALPNKWLMGQAAGVAVDRQGHVWVIQRPKTLTEDERAATLTPPRSECCVPAPPVLEFDAEGNLLGARGRPGAGPRLAGERAWDPRR